MCGVMSQTDASSRMKDSFSQLLGMLPLFHFVFFCCCFSLQPPPSPKDTTASGDSLQPVTDEFILGYQIQPQYLT